MFNEILGSEEIFTKIDAIRRDKGWSFYKLAQEANISKSTIYKWRDGKSQPTLYLIEAISDAYKMPVVNLLYDEATLTALNCEQRSVLDDWLSLNRDQQVLLKNLISQMKQAKMNGAER